VPGRIVFDSRSAIRHRLGHASGPARSSVRLYWGTRNRLINARRHLDGVALVKSLVASAGFDALTLAQLRSRESTRLVLRGWRDGLRAMRLERSARAPAERSVAALRLVPLRTAIAQQRRLGRL
jgi:hypothetical protein